MTTSFSPVVSADRLSVQVAQRLANEIREGRLSPGDKLPTEAQLVEQFQVSRTVVREALSRLKSLGLVASRQGSGVYVDQSAAFEPLNFDARHAASREAVIHIVEVRRALEAECAQLAAEKRTAADLRGIQQALKALDVAVGLGASDLAPELAVDQYNAVEVAAFHGGAQCGDGDEWGACVHEMSFRWWVVKTFT